MKTRHGFVSNSSASSFVISKSNLTYAEGQLLLGFLQVQKENEYWDIYDEDTQIRGYTFMDNGQFWDYLESIGFDEDRLEYKDLS